MIKQDDYAAFLRMDNASTIDFLTSIAGVFVEDQIIERKESDNLRVALSGITHVGNGSTDPSQTHSVIQKLDERRAEFIDIMQARYGSIDFVRNLLRYGLRNIFGNTSEILNQWGSNLLKKSELLFNRSIYIFCGSKADHETLISGILVEYSQTIALCFDKINRISQNVDRYLPANMAALSSTDLDLDHKIANSVGFSQVASDDYSILTESIAVQEFIAAIHIILTSTDFFLKQISKNQMTSLGQDEFWSYDVFSAKAELTGELNRLQGMVTPSSDHLPSWEIYRQGLCESLTSINHSIACLSEAIVNSINGNMQSAHNKLSQDATRRIAFDLITTGLSPKSSWEAAIALCKYCETNQLRPTQIIYAELPKIHAHLTPKALDSLHLVEKSHQTVTKKNKRRIMSRSKELKNKFG